MRQPKCFMRLFMLNTIQGDLPMTDVIRSGDCGNSPKNIFVQELSITLATHDSASLLAGVSDTIRWQIVGEA